MQQQVGRLIKNIILYPHLGSPTPFCGYFYFMDYTKNLDLESIFYFCERNNQFEIERWKDIPGYEGLYQVSCLGRVKSLKRLAENKHGYRPVKERIKKQGLTKDGYYCSRLSKNSKTKLATTHILSAMAFLNHKPCGMKSVINHKNFIRTDNKLYNLEVVTQRENTSHRILKSSSQYTGVYCVKTGKKWVARIYVKPKTRYLGTFANEHDAHLAYQKVLSEVNNL